MCEIFLFFSFCHLRAFCRERKFAAKKLFAEIVSVEALKKQQKTENNIEVLEHVTKHIYENPNKYKIKLIRLPSYIDRQDIRFTIDDIVDFNNCKKLYKDYHKLTMEEIVKIIDTKKEIKNTMLSNIKKYSK